MEIEAVTSGDRRDRLDVVARADARPAETRHDGGREVPRIPIRPNGPVQGAAVHAEALALDRHPTRLASPMPAIRTALSIEEWACAEQYTRTAGCRERPS